MKINEMLTSQNARASNRRIATAKPQLSNQRIRNTLSQYGMKQWQLAERLGVREDSLSRILRHELSEDEQTQICNLIKEVANE